MISLTISTDEVRARKLAKNLQRRMADLGVSLKLNHAYEAVSNVFGFENWAVMKSKLDTGAISGPSANSPRCSVPPLKKMVEHRFYTTIHSDRSEVLFRAAEGDEWYIPKQVVVFKAIDQERIRDMTVDRIYYGCKAANRSSDVRILDITGFGAAVGNRVNYLRMSENAKHLAEALITEDAPNGTPLSVARARKCAEKMLELCFSDPALPRTVSNFTSRLGEIISDVKNSAKLFESGPSTIHSAMNQMLRRLSSHENLFANSAKWQGPSSVADEDHIVLVLVPEKPDDTQRALMSMAMESLATSLEILDPGARGDLMIVFQDVDTLDEEMSVAVCKAGARAGAKIVILNRCPTPPDFLDD